MPVEAATEPGHEHTLTAVINQLRTKKHEFYANYRGSRIMLQSRPESSTYVSSAPQRDGVVIAFGKTAEMAWSYYFVVTPKMLYLMDNTRSDALVKVPAANTIVETIAAGFKAIDKYLYSRVFGTWFRRNDRVYIGHLDTKDDSVTGMRVDTKTFTFRVRAPNQADREVSLAAKDVLDVLWVAGPDQFFRELIRLVRARMAVPGAVEAAAEPQPQANHTLRMFLWVHSTHATTVSTCSDVQRQMQTLLASRKHMHVREVHPTKYASPTDMLVSFYVTFSDPQADLTFLVALLAKQDWVSGFSNNLDSDDSFIKKTDKQEIKTMLSDIMDNEVYVTGAAEPQPNPIKPVGGLRVAVLLKEKPPEPDSPERKVLEARLNKMLRLGAVVCSFNHLQFSLLVDKETTDADLIRFSHDISSMFTNMSQRTIGDAVQKAYAAGKKRPTLATAVMTTMLPGPYALRAEEVKAAVEPEVLERPRAWYRLPFVLRYGARFDRLVQALEKAGYRVDTGRRISDRGLKTEDIILDVRIDASTSGMAWKHMQRIAEITNNIAKPRVQVVPNHQDLQKLMHTVRHVSAATEPQSEARFSIAVVTRYSQDQYTANDAEVKAVRMQIKNAFRTCNFHVGREEFLPGDYGDLDDGGFGVLFAYEARDVKHTGQQFEQDAVRLAHTLGDIHDLAWDLDVAAVARKIVNASRKGDTSFFTAEAAVEPGNAQLRIWYTPLIVRSRDRADALEKELHRVGYETSFDRLISERGVKLADISLDVRIVFNTPTELAAHMHKIAEIANQVLKPSRKVVVTKESVEQHLNTCKAFSKRAHAAAEPPATLLHIPDLHLLTDLDPDETGSSSLHEACDEIGEVLERYGFDGGEVAVHKIVLDEGDQDYNWCLQAENLTFTGTPVQLMHKFTEMLQYLSQHRDIGVNIKRKDIPAYVKDMHEAVLRTQHGHDSTVTMGSTASTPQLLIGTRTIRQKKVEPMAKATAAAETAPRIPKVSFRMLLDSRNHDKAVKYVEDLLRTNNIEYGKLDVRNGDVFDVDTREDGEAASDASTFILTDVRVPSKIAGENFARDIFNHDNFQGSAEDVNQLRCGLTHGRSVHAAAEPQPKPDPAPARKPGQPEPYVHAVDGKIRGLLQLLTKWTAAEKNAVGKESLRKILVLCKNEAWPRLAEESKKKLLELK